MHSPRGRPMHTPRKTALPGTSHSLTSPLLDVLVLSFFVLAISWSLLGLSGGTVTASSLLQPLYNPSLSGKFPSYHTHSVLFAWTIGQANTAPQTIPTLSGFHAFFPPKFNSFGKFILPLFTSSGKTLTFLEEISHLEISHHKRCSWVKTQIIFCLCSQPFFCHA